MSLIDGWVFEDNVVPFLEHLSRYIGYVYDDLDESALTVVLAQTDDESAAGWFRYPLEGTPPVMVSLAQAVGGTVVSIRVEGDIDPILTARIETLLDLL